MILIIFSISPGPLLNEGPAQRRAVQLAAEQEAEADARQR